MSTLGSAVFKFSLSAALASFLLISCSGKEEAAKEAGPPKRPPVPVVTGKTARSDIDVSNTFMGTVESLQSTPVKAQVGGTLVAADVTDGKTVARGQVIFRIDSRPIEGSIRQLEAEILRWDAQIRTAEMQLKALENQVKTAKAQTGASEANLAGAKNQAALAKAQKERYAGLLEKQFITREQYDQISTAAETSKSSAEAAASSAEASRSAAETAASNVEAARSSIEAMRASRAASEAQLENAKVQLGYTKIVSPVAGVAGSLFAKPGDYVKGNGDTTLVVINQLNPIRVKFALPENLLAEVMKLRKDKSLKVAVTLSTGELREGRIDYIDNAVDRQTGTIAVRAAFDNADSALWPGQFVNIRLTLYTLKNVVTVPSAAIQTGQKGPYVYVIGQDAKATLKPLTPGYSSGLVTVVDQGLTEGERVVVDGHLRLSKGADTVEKPVSGGPAGSPEAGGKKAAEGKGASK